MKLSPTEMRNERTMNISSADTATMLKLINDENRRSVEAVDAAIPQIAKAVDAVVNAFNNGGRLVYVGAGTSGRLATADAAECPPTFGVDYNTVVAIMAGGEAALTHASENIEDLGDAGVRDAKAKNVTSLDVVMGVSASGNADYVASVLEYAKSLGCITISLSSNEDCRIGRIADIPIFTDTGAEAITGSTRMKAGNAQKMVMNMISTSAMVKTGKVYENLMINLRPTNIKLRARMIRITEDILGVDATEAEALLEEAGFSIPRAIEIKKEKGNG